MFHVFVTNLILWRSHSATVVMVTATEASRYAGKAEEAFNLALDYFSSADDVYHQVGGLERVFRCCGALLHHLIVFFFRVAPVGFSCLSFRAANDVKSPLRLSAFK